MGQKKNIFSNQTVLLFSFLENVRRKGSVLCPVWVNL